MKMAQNSDLRPSTSLQENVLTLICYDDAQGKILANMVTADLFEGDYRSIAEHALKFWNLYRSAPKEAHTADFLDDILKGNTNSRRMELFRRLIVSMYQLSQSINVPYVMGQIKNFIRMQRLKAAIIESAEKINKDDHIAIEEIENIWSDLLRAQEIGFEPGMRLTEVDRLLEHLEKRSAEFIMGISVLDKRGVVPIRATLTNLQGVLGEGKTWYLVCVGRHNLRLRKKIVHYSLEMSEEDIIQRYVQSIWAISTREMQKVVTSGLKTENGRLKEFTERIIRPDFSFESPNIKLELETRMEIMGAMADNLIVKRFPPRRITDRQINAHLDGLEATEGFIPDMLLFDAPYLYKTNVEHARLSLEGHVVDTRATCIERNVAGVMVHWINREGAREKRRDLTHTSEAFMINATCDQALSLSKTRAEEEFGLARIGVDKARNVKDKFEILITQAYEVGQFCLESMPMDASYHAKIKELTGADNDDDTERDTGADDDEE